MFVITWDGLFVRDGPLAALFVGQQANLLLLKPTTLTRGMGLSA